ncbi:hypothetical protein K3495_g4136 [Podosphaera aphanis]|nr:hypothetical protein K3495_g4136 [Podosphaera aphanis]
MGRYGGTILTGRENFTLWQGNLEIELAAARLKKFLRLEHCVAPIFKTADVNLHTNLKEWEFQHTQAFKFILQSVDNTHRIAIQSCRTACQAYETLRSRYGMKNTALLAQLLTQIFSIQSMKQSNVTEKYDLIINLSTQIADQEPDAKIPDIIQVVILMQSLPSSYDTTIEILTSKEKFRTVNDVIQAIKSTETKLDEPIEEIEIANAAHKSGSSQVKVCWVCQGDHTKPKCPRWLATEEGRKFKQSGLKWYKWRELDKDKKYFANSSMAVNTCMTPEGNIVDFSDSESIENSASGSSLTSGAWGLDTMCSCHLIPHKDAFIGELRPVRLPIDVPNGSIIYSEGRGDVRIYWNNNFSSQHPRSTILRDVLYVPKVSINLISVGALTDKRHTWNCSNTDMHIYTKYGRLLFRGI